MTAMGRPSSTAHSTATSGDTITASSSMTVRNSIIWNDAPSGAASNVTYTNSDVQGGVPGSTNINSDPLFVHEAQANVHDIGNLLLQSSSPARDKGKNPDVPSEYHHEPRLVSHRINSGTVDIGAMSTRRFHHWRSIRIMVSIRCGDGEHLRWQPNADVCGGIQQIDQSFQHQQPKAW